MALVLVINFFYWSEDAREVSLSQLTFLLDQRELLKFMAVVQLNIEPKRKVEEVEWSSTFVNSC